MTLWRPDPALIHRPAYLSLADLAGWRMQLATRLLAEHSMKLRAIADAVGYASEAAFSRAFKKHTGLSPQAWRQR